MPVTRFPSLIVLVVALAGCTSGPERAPVIGEAFVGPATLVLRQDLHPRSTAAATVKHGERLEVLLRRRRFFRVRTAQGIEGWTDARQLLASSEMARLRQAAEKAARLPSHGRATVYDALNLHTEPNRQSPSFGQIPERGSVEVVAYRLVTRAPYTSPILNLGAAEPPPPRKKAKKKDDQLPPPPVPRPPAPPAPAAPAEDWSLVRTKDGKAGWVLTRALTMAIPDEVAQYAEGHRITSYFSLGEVRDGELAKTTWLWTTLAKTQQPYLFDSFRVFVWSTRRHRYETAYIERNVEGYFPVSAQPGAPGFALVLRGKDGALTRRTYAFVGQRVRLVNKEPWTQPPEPDDKAEALAPAPAPGSGPRPGFLERMKEKFAAWRARWFKR
jgi:SH3-like domain-containing protein